MQKALHNKKSTHKANAVATHRANAITTHTYQQGDKFKGHNSPQIWPRETPRDYKDEPRSLKSKVNRILKYDTSGRVRMMRKFA